MWVKFAGKPSIRVLQVPSGMVIHATHYDETMVFVPCTPEQYLEFIDGKDEDEE